MGLSNLNRGVLFDPIRSEWVKATAEEIVRQRWIHHMVGSLGFPKELFVVEKSLSELPHLYEKKVSDRRIDLLVYASFGERLIPLILIECKRGSLLPSHREQLIGYNHHVEALSIALVNHDAVLFGFREGLDKEYQFHDFIPSFAELNKWIVV